ncbi:probable ATP-dependent RNA helicase DDX60 [Sphaerodactylus townsendi]|uniref:probable ATP-dependent RNA helicase DDX60 n=1 Tax=Sphaerodactylus townsendi TaxID=933632 RepID=UPI002025DC4F|nr:probable ATP-dependent RNA helicase DDX60 [Sphaerodactylus townsendi]
MASAESDSEEEFSKEESDSDNFDSDLSEGTDCFLEDLSSLLDQQEEPNNDKSHGSFLEVVNTEDGNYTVCKEDSKMPEDSSPQDPRTLWIYHGYSQLVTTNMRIATDYSLSLQHTPRYSSILNDFVESEFFVIDGDSLLVRCLCTQGPFLSFIYTAECFLNDFIQKGARFIIVFFKDAEQMYFSQPYLLFLRTMLIQHLENNTDIILHTEFSNCLSPEWQSFLNESCPYFMIISDMGMTSIQTDYLNIFLSHSLSKKINVVLAFGEGSDILRVYAYHVQSMYEHREFFMLVCYNTSFKNQDAIEELTMEEAADLCRIQCLSVAFLCNLPLQRAAGVIHQILLDFTSPPICTDVPTLYQQPLEFTQSRHPKSNLQRCDYLVLKYLNFEDDWKLDFTYLPDLRDNFLWKNLVYHYESEYCAGLKLELGKEIEKDYRYLWNTATTIVDLCDLGDAFPVRNTSKLLLQQSEITAKECSDVPSFGLIPVKSDIVEDYIGTILEDLSFLRSNESTVTVLPKHKEFDELLHWHSNRSLSDDYDRTKCSFEAKTNDRDQRKQVQKLQSYYQLYGKSLEGDISQTVVNLEDVTLSTKAAIKKLKKSQRSSKAEKIAEDNKKRQKTKQEKKDSDQWHALEKSIEKDIKTNLTSGMKRFEMFLKTCQSNSVKFIAEMAGLNFCLEVWKEHCRSQGLGPKDLNVAVQVMKRIHMILDKHHEFLHKSHLNTLARGMQCLGFEKLATSLNSQVNYFDSALVESSNEKLAKYSVGIGAARFQLQYMGHYLFRDERTDPDLRVQHFIPDTWQRELLDVVDNNESAVIVAPTSSGKTYASYYCMEKILRQSNEGVVVYVSPTKALVNQVVATIYNRFSKKLPDGLVVCGVFTRDYRHDVLNCQILVTVPQCLEILVLSPHRQAWVKRIKYVIFDEVHCLGGEIGAEVWEHLLVMIRCPFLALSATISNPKHLTEWLQSVKNYWRETESTMDETTASSAGVTRCTKKLQKQQSEKKSYKVRLVLYGERYNDLEKHVCSLKDNDVVLDHYHPCAALTANHIEKYGIPLDMAFSPRESIQLYDAMLNSWPEWPRAHELEPEEYICFKNKITIKKADVRKYEQDLKEELSGWVAVGEKDKLNHVLESLKPHPTDSSEYEKFRRFPLLVDKLNAMDKLPAIFFMFNIHSVEEAAGNIFRNVIKKQKESSMQNPNTEKEVQNLKNKLSKMKKKIQTIDSLDPKKQTLSKVENVIAILTEYDALKKRLAKLTTVPPECTYANQRALDEMIFRKLLFRLRRESSGGYQAMLAKRGIGYHHSAMSSKQKQFVEMLFRMGYIRVVTATSTLALGINMPCKSVVFLQDSVYLDALNFRQMSGRAGRRGQDLIGNVFFYGIPLPKVQKLMKSNVPELRGQFPLSITLVLRLMLLTAKAEDKADAKAKVLSVLNHSLLSFSQQRNKDILKIYFIFSFQFLLKEGYLDQEGMPLGYAGLVSHLHYHEPSNFVLVDFLTKGLLHKLCQPVTKGSAIFSEDVMQTLVLVLAHLFGRRHLPPFLTKFKKTFVQSKVFLEDLPEEFAAAVKAYNSKIENNFGCFLLSAAKLADMEQEYHLPLSNLDFSDTEQLESQLASHLMNCSEERTAVSPFVCLSGNTELDLLNARTVNSVLLRTIGITAANIPLFCSEKYDNQGRIMPLNAYVLDFYKHGSLKAMAQDNSLHGDAYYLLRDFALAVKAISVSLRELCDNEDDNVVQAFEQLSKEYWNKLDKV